VAEACSGLRYLFPLLVLGFIMSVFYKAPFWKRALVFASSVPITVLMNSIRIGVIGVTVEHWGTGMAEGVLHDFQGWLVFMLSAGLMLAEIALLSRVGPDRTPWRELFAIELPARDPAAAAPDGSGITAPMIAAVALPVLYLACVAWIPQHPPAIPTRESFPDFPLQIGAWSGRTQSIEPIYLKTLKLDDYILADYQAEGHSPVNFYSAWYGTQTAGRSAHSPRSCLPGGGWRIKEFSQVRLQTVAGPQGPLRVNRVLISLDDQQMVVYYWFQQRGRVITNEYLVKWYLFWDALTRNRTDGALVRLTVPVSVGSSPAQAERSLVEFAGLAEARLSAYVPE
jgi:exosortase D (VPLPA-CTERM-specific)